MTRENTKQVKVIREFILNNVADHPNDIGPLTGEKFGVSRSTAAKHLRWLIAQGLISAIGNTRARKYDLVLITDEVFEIQVTPGLQEDLIWRQKVSQLVIHAKAKESVIDICNHGFTEILNNAFDHSGSETVRIHVYINAVSIQIYIIDFGVGIFKKIQNHFGLNDPRHALLELAKGKLTSDKSKHSGEGIFFTSRMFDKFSILSGELYFARINKNHDWLVEVEDRNEFKGTSVMMSISINAEQTSKEIFDKYASENDDYGFTKTHVPISLTKYDDGQLVSRSSAKRILARFSDFKEVWLDFKGIPTIGQAFADEIFRVYAISHPDIEIVCTSVSDDVQKMINRAKSALIENNDPQMSLIE